MKTTAKILTGIVAAALCTSMALTGAAAFAPSAEDYGTSCAQTENFSCSPLKDGAWEGTDASGSRIWIVVDSENGTMSFITESEENEVCADFTFISAIGMYDLTMMDSGDEGQLRVLSNDGENAVLQSERLGCIEFSYIDPLMQESNETGALRSGVWQAVDENGDSMFYIVNEDECAIQMLHPEMMIGVPCSYTYDWESDQYDVTIGSPDWEEVWTMNYNDGYTASLTKSTGETFTLYYINDRINNNFKCYTYEQFRAMAKNYYESINGSQNGIGYAAKLRPDGSGDVDVYVYASGAHGYTIDVYTVNSEIGQGTDSLGNFVNLADYAE